MTERPAARGRRTKSVCWPCFAGRLVIWAVVLFVILTFVLPFLGDADLLSRILWVGVGLAVVTVGDLRLIVFRRSRPSA